MKLIVTTYLFILIGMHAFAQHQNQLYRGNQSYLDGDYDQAQMYYQQALSGDPRLYEGNLNLGNANFRKQDFEGAISMYQTAAENSIDDVKRAKALHNLGNTYLQNQKIDEAIDAYKNALRANPKADETRYNLAYAQHLKKQQQEQEQKNKDQNKDNEPDLKPSEYAKKLKKHCDWLTETFQFREAYSQMQNGLKKDKTVAYYSDYIKRLGNVCGIEE